MTDNTKIEKEERALVKETIGPDIGFRAIYITNAREPGWCVTLYHIGMVSRTKTEAINGAAMRLEALPLRRTVKVKFESVHTRSGQSWQRWKHLDDICDSDSE